MTRTVKGVEYKWAVDLGLPLLVLATDEPHKFTGARKWEAIYHQTGGPACHKKYMMATVLQPRQELEGRIWKLTETWRRTDTGAWMVTLESINRYNAQLQELFGVDCKTSYGNFQEGIYPIDITPDSLRKLTAEELPKNLNNLVDWKGETKEHLQKKFPDKEFDKLEPNVQKQLIGLSEFAGCMARWNLYILGHNK